MVLARSLANPSAGKRRAARTEMMAITTRSSINVKAAARTRGAYNRVTGPCGETEQFLSIMDDLYCSLREDFAARRKS